MKFESATFRNPNHIISVGCWWHCLKHLKTCSLLGLVHSAAGQRLEAMPHPLWGHKSGALSAPRCHHGHKWHKWQWDDLGWSLGHQGFAMFWHVLSRTQAPKIRSFGVRVLVESNLEDSDDAAFTCFHAILCIVSLDRVWSDKAGWVWKVGWRNSERSPSCKEISWTLH
jgi:hypothetical protein